MKRPASDSAIEQPDRVMRRKTQCADFKSSALAPVPKPSFQTLAESQQPHYSTQRSIQRWVESCPADCVPDMTPPTPRDTSASGRGRLNPRSRGSRTPSPTKRTPAKPTPETYRIVTLYRYRVFVDHLIVLPQAIDEEVRQILGVESWEDPVVATVNEVQTEHLDKLISAFRTKSQTCARQCSLEDDWKHTLVTLVDGLSELWPGELRKNISQKTWDMGLKPLLAELPNEAPSASAQYPLPDFNPDTMAAAASGFSRPIPFLPPNAQWAAPATTGTLTSASASIEAPTTSTEAAKPNHISTPKPDMTIGLEHSAFDGRHQQLLDNYQQSGSLISDPHKAGMHLRFPFMIAEMKGLSLNGSLVAAQNQAAIGGASILTILDDLSSLSLASNPGLLDTLPPKLCFSIVTAGPVYELWVHFEHKGATYMEFLQLWRVTHGSGARNFVHFLYRIIAWGRGRFKDCIQEQLNTIQ